MEITPLLAQAFTGSLLFMAVVGLALFIGGLIVLNFGMIYIRALFSGAKVTFTELIALKLRGVPVGIIVHPHHGGEVRHSHHHRRPVHALPCRRQH